jgi:hypothetical protein
MTVTEKDIMKVKNEVREIRDKSIGAQATYDEVCANISTQESKLKELGVKPDEVEDFIKSQEEIVETKYLEVKDKINKWYNADDEE